MTPEEVEQRVVKPIEQEMLSIPNKRIVRSISKYGIADITIDFDEGVDIYWARQQVSERLGGVMRDLPASVSGGLAPISTPLSEVYMFTVEGQTTAWPSVAASSIGSSVPRCAPLPVWQKSTHSVARCRALKSFPTPPRWPPWAYA